MREFIVTQDVVTKSRNIYYLPEEEVDGLLIRVEHGLQAGGEEPPSQCDTGGGGSTVVLYVNVVGEFCALQLPICNSQTLFVIKNSAHTHHLFLHNTSCCFILNKFLTLSQLYQLIIHN